MWKKLILNHHQEQRQTKTLEDAEVQMGKTIKIIKNDQTKTSSVEKNQTKSINNRIFPRSKVGRWWHQRQLWNDGAD